MSTICAIATPAGGAIGIIRISGPEAIAQTERIFRPAGKTPLAACPANTATYGTIVDPTDPAAVIDDAVVTIYRAPRSYTGEDAAEISLHGSAYILQRVLSLLTEGGCRPAAPGEYTRRAFLAGKMDLSQAEAVADVIAAQNAASLRVAVSQMRGGFRTRLHQLRDALLRLTSLLELELDFSDHEDLEFADRTELRNLAADIHADVSRLASSFAVGNVLKNGVPTVLIGATNAGKSTLLNAIVGEERAIVSPIHGTTRDVIEDVVTIGDVTFRLADTAGLRTTTDAIENIGIARSYDRLSAAAIALLLVDAPALAKALEEGEAKSELLASKFPLATLPAEIQSQYAEIQARAGDKPLIIVLTKRDLLTPAQTELLSSHFADELTRFAGITPEAPAAKYPVATLISARTGEGLDALKTALVATALPAHAADELIVTNARHYEALTSASAALTRVEQGLAQGLSADLLSEDLRDVLAHLATITGGAITPDEVLGNIFSHFCIGK